MNSKQMFFKIGINTSIQTGGRAISLVLGVTTTAILTRYLGTFGYGNYTLVFAYLSFFSTIADFGLQLTMVREISQKKHDLSQLYGAYLWLKIVLVGGSSLLAVLFLLFFPYSPELKTAILVGVVAVAIGNVTSYGITIFQSNIRLDLITLVDVITKIITVLLIAIFINFHLNLYYLIAAVGIGNLIGFLLTFIILRKKMQVQLLFDTNLVKYIVKMSIPVGFTTFISLLYFKLDTVMLSLFTNAGSVGIYSLSYKIFENTLVLWGFYMASVFPLLSQFHGANGKKLHSVLLQKSMILAVCVGALFVLGTYILAPFFVQIFGSREFVDSIIPLRILAISIPLFFLDNIFYSLLIVQERLKEILLVMLVALCINIMLNLYFIPHFGYIGASITTILTECSVFIGYIICLKKLLFSHTLQKK